MKPTVTTKFVSVSILHVHNETTRDILGKCKALWGKPRTLLRLSQRSTELSCTRFDEERSKKSKAIDEQRCGTVFFCVNTSAHARVRLSYEFRL